MPRIEFSTYLLLPTFTQETVLILLINKKTNLVRVRGEGRVVRLKACHVLGTVKHTGLYKDEYENVSDLKKIIVMNQVAQVSDVTESNKGSNACTYSVLHI